MSYLTFSDQGFGDLADFNGQFVTIDRAITPAERADDDSLYPDLLYFVKFPNGAKIAASGDELVIQLVAFDIDAMIDGYVETALWADYMPAPTPDNPEPELGGGDGMGIEPDAESKVRVRETCEQFFLFNAADCIEFLEHGDESDLGHNLWLTSHGHGTGFWDRGLGALGDRLTKAAKTAATSTAVAMDNGDGTVEIL